VAHRRPVAAPQSSTSPSRWTRRSCCWPWQAWPGAGPRLDRPGGAQHVRADGEERSPRTAYHGWL